MNITKIKVSKSKRFLILFSALAIIGLSSYSTSLVLDSYSNPVIENLECKYGQCQATAKSTNKRCKHCVSKKGDSYCWQHKD